MRHHGVDTKLLLRGDQRAALIGSKPVFMLQVRAEISDDEDYITNLGAPPDAAENIVNGYRVKVRRVGVSAEETRSRRDAVARIVARSLSREVRGLTSRR